MESPFYIESLLVGSVECHAMQRIIVTLSIVFYGFFGRAEGATLNCEHLLVVSQTTIALRDQGHTLSAVLAEVERDKLQQKLEAHEINLLRQVVRISFTSEYTPREILTACKDGSLGIAKSK